jgi:hypothetical protein
MSDEEFVEFNTEGLDINPSLEVRYRFGAPGETSVYPPAILLTFSFVRGGRPMRSHVTYGRYWEREEPPTDEDRGVLMEWAKQSLETDLATVLDRDPTEAEPTRFMPRES